MSKKKIYLRIDKASETSTHYLKISVEGFTPHMIDLVMKQCASEYQVTMSEVKVITKAEFKAVAREQEVIEEMVEDWNNLCKAAMKWETHGIDIRL